MSQELEYRVNITTDKVEPSDLISPGAIQSLVELNDQIDSFRRQLVDLKEIEKEQGTLTDEQATKQQLLKNELKETSTEYGRQQRELIKVDTASKALGDSYNDLVKQNAAISAAMRAMPIGDTSEEMKKLQAQYVANNDRLKDFDKSMGNHQRNVGNYGSALSNLGGVLKSVPGPIGDIVKTFEQFNKVLGAAGVSMASKTTATNAGTTATAANAAATSTNATAQTGQAAATGVATVAQKALNLAMKANPILLVVGLIATLMAAFSKFQPVIDFATKQFQILTNVMLFFVDKVGGFFGIIEATEFSLAETVKITAQLADEEVKLRDAKRESVEFLANQNLEMSQLRLKAADMTKSDQERMDIMTQIEEVSRESMDYRIALAQRELDIAVLRAKLNHSDAAVLDDLAEKRAKLAEIETQSNMELIRVVTRKSGLEQKAIDDQIRNEQKLAQEQKKLREEKAAREKQLNDIKLADFYALQEEIRIAEQQSLDYLPELDLGNSERDKVQLERLDKFGEELADQTIQQAIRTGDKLLALKLQQDEELRQRRLQYLSQGFTIEEAAQMAIEDMSVRHTKELQDKTVEIEKDSAKTREDIALNVASNAISIGTSLFGKSKALSVAQAIIDTYAAANNAAKNTEGGVVVKAIAAAAVIAAGLANVKKILSTKLGSASIGAGSTATVGASTANIGATQAAMLTPRASANEIGTLSRMEGSKERFSSRAEPRITVTANVDRRGLAIAVRDGERSIRTQQYDFK